jgi:hypothetical protein
MFRKARKSLLALGAVAWLAPVVSSAQSGKPCATAVPCTAAMPEGGSAALYLVAAGLVCAGAFILRTRFRKSQES